MVHSDRPTIEAATILLLGRAMRKWEGPGAGPGGWRVRGAEWKRAEPAYERNSSLRKTTTISFTVALVLPCRFSCHAQERGINLRNSSS